MVVPQAMQAMLQLQCGQARLKLQKELSRKVNRTSRNNLMPLGVEREREREREEAEKLYFWSKKRRIGVRSRSRSSFVVITFGSDSSTDIQLGGGGGKARQGNEETGWRRRSGRGKTTQGHGRNFRPLRISLRSPSSSFSKDKAN